MKIHSTLLAIVASFGAVYAEEPLSIETDPTWDVRFRSVPSYVWTAKDEKSGLALGLDYQNQGKSIEDIARRMQSMSDAYKRVTPPPKDVSTGVIKGQFVRGGFVKIKRDESLSSSDGWPSFQTIVEIEHENAGWNGSYTGSEANWDEALKILSSIRVLKAEDPLSIKTDPATTWTVHSQILPTYFLTKKEGPSSIILQSERQAQGKDEDVASWIKNELERRKRKVPPPKDVSAGVIKGQFLSGGFVKVSTGEFVSASVLIAFENGRWSGSYSGSGATWNEALKILSSIK